MKQTITAMVLFLTMIVSAGPIPEAAAGSRWYNYAEGIAAGKQAGKKVLLYFRTDWCTYCKKMDSDTLNHQKIVEYMDRHFIPVRIDSDQETDLARKYAVQGLPTVWFLDGEGEKISQLPGFVPPETFLTILRYIATESYRTMSFRTFLDSEPR